MSATSSFAKGDRVRYIHAIEDTIADCGTVNIVDDLTPQCALVTYDSGEMLWTRCDNLRSVTTDSPD